MSKIDYASYHPENVVDLQRYQRGGEPPGGNDMEARVATLEKKFDKMESKLDTIGTDMAYIKAKLDILPSNQALLDRVVTDMAYIKGRLESLPSAQSFGELKGRVDSLPTTAKIATIISIAIGVFTLITSWNEFIAFFK
jgi:hypothetical protein